MLEARGDGTPLAQIDEQAPAAEGKVEAGTERGRAWA